MSNETITGTRAVAQRLALADEHFIQTIMGGGFARPDALHIFAVWKKHRCIKRLGVDGWTVKHGGFWEHDAMVRALEMANAD